MVIGTPPILEDITPTICATQEQKGLWRMVILNPARINGKAMSGRSGDNDRIPAKYL
jgi:hypothetical protein